MSLGKQMGYAAMTFLKKELLYYRSLLHFSVVKSSCFNLFFLTEDATCWVIGCELAGVWIGNP